MMKKALIVATLITAGVSSVCMADTAQENTDLALVVRQLQALYPLIYAAEKEADPQSREQFHYDWLRQDVHTLIVGINQKLTPLPIEPREIKPLRGDYLTVKSNTL